MVKQNLGRSPQPGPADRAADRAQCSGPCLPTGTSALDDAETSALVGCHHGARDCKQSPVLAGAARQAFHCEKEISTN